MQTFKVIKKAEMIPAKDQKPAPKPLAKVSWLDEARKAIEDRRQAERLSFFGLKA